MPASHVLAPHDDGRLYVAELLDQYRDRDGAWRVVVTYSTAPGFAYIRAMHAADCRRLPEQPDGQRDTGQGHGEPDGEHDPAGPLVAWGRHEPRR